MYFQTRDERLNYERFLKIASAALSDITLKNFSYTYQQFKEDLKKCDMGGRYSKMMDLNNLSILIFQYNIPKHCTVHVRTSLLYPLPTSKHT